MTRQLNHNMYQIVKIQRPRHSLFVDQSESSVFKGSWDGWRHWDPVTRWINPCCKQSQTTSCRKRQFHCIKILIERRKHTTNLLGQLQQPRWKTRPGMTYKWTHSMTSHVACQHREERILVSRIFSDLFRSVLRTIACYWMHWSITIMHTTTCRAYRSSPADSSPTSIAYQSLSKWSEKSMFRLRQLPPPRNHCRRQHC